MKIRQVIIILLISHVFGCSSTKELNEPFHGDNNVPPLLVVTDSNQIYYSKDDTIPPHDFIPYEVEPKVLHQAKPVYPPLEVVFGKQADVFVKAWINKKGHVVQAVVFKSTDDQFNKAAAQAAMQFEFSPALLKGKPVSVWVSIPFRFRIKRGCSA
jgi:TonB family protein